MAQEEIRDILALAELEEADAPHDRIDADPLGFKWVAPFV
jgi:hypothetical protein